MTTMMVAMVMAMTTTMINSLDRIKYQSLPAGTVNFDCARYFCSPLGRIPAQLATPRKRSKQGWLMRHCVQLTELAPFPSAPLRGNTLRSLCVLRALREMFREVSRGGVPRRGACRLSGSRRVEYPLGLQSLASSANKGGAAEVRSSSICYSFHLPQAEVIHVAFHSLVAQIGQGLHVLLHLLLVAREGLSAFVIDHHGLLALEHNPVGA